MCYRRVRNELAVKQPLLLIMGLGATLEWWRRLIPILSSRYRTIVYDNRGVGRSDVPEGPYSIPAMAEDAAAVMDAAGMASAHVFGASMGGMIAQELALNHPVARALADSRLHRLRRPAGRTGGEGGRRSRSAREKR